MRGLTWVSRTNGFRLLTVLALCIFSFPSYAQRDAGAHQETFNEALVLRADGDVHRAAEMFQNILKESPLRTRVRLELAITYYLSKKFSEAERELALILADESIPQNVRNNSELFLAKVYQRLATEKDKRNSTFTGNISLLTATDSNANSAPEDTALDIGTLPSSSIARSDNYVGVRANLRHRYQLKETHFGSQELSLQWKNGFSGLFRQYEHEDDSNLGISSFYTGIGVQSANSWASDIRIRTDQIRLGGESLAGYYSILPSYTHLFGNSSLTIAGSYTLREYFQKEFAGREGYKSDLGVYWLRPLSDGLVFRLGLQAADTNLEQKWRSYSGFSSSVLLIKKINSALSLTLSTRYESNRYDANHPNYVDKRDDDLLFATLSLQYKFKKDIQIEGKYYYVDRQSTNDVFNYDRSRLELSIRYGFSL